MSLIKDKISSEQQLTQHEFKAVATQLHFLYLLIPLHFLLPVFPEGKDKETPLQLCQSAESIRFAYDQVNLILHQIASLSDQASLPEVNYLYQQHAIESIIRAFNSGVGYPYLHVEANNRIKYG